MNTYYNRHWCLYLNELGVRSLANASRARQFNPLNPPGVGTASSNKYSSCGRSCAVVRGRSCVVMRGRARSVVRGRSCAVGRARSVVRGRAWSCVVGRARSCAVVREWSVIRGRAWSCVVVRGRAWSCRSARFAASTAVARTNERTTSNNPLSPPGVGWVNFFF